MTKYSSAPCGSSERMLSKLCCAIPLLLFSLLLLCPGADGAGGSRGLRGPPRSLSWAHHGLAAILHASVEPAECTLYLRGGELPVTSSLAGTGRVADMWDVHVMRTGKDGEIAIFRHSTLGTAVELHESSNGLFWFIENDHRNVSWVTSYGEARRGGESTEPLLRRGLDWWDPDDGFACPDMLQELCQAPGKWPMVAEWLDVGPWQAYDDGSTPFLNITHIPSGAVLALTPAGFIFSGAPAGPLQPHKPRGVRVEAGQAAEQLSARGAQAALDQLKASGWTQDLSKRQRDVSQRQPPSSAEPALPLLTGTKQEQNVQVPQKSNQ